PLAFDVWLRSAAGEWKLEEQLARPIRRGEPATAIIDGLAPPHLSTRDLSIEFGQPGATVDVILRPTTAPAVRTTDVAEIWGEDIVFRDVPVTFDPRGTV